MASLKRTVKALRYHFANGTYVDEVVPEGMTPEHCINGLADVLTGGGNEVPAVLRIRVRASRSTTVVPQLVFTSHLVRVELILTPAS